jgi:hypothetical protein
VPCFTATVATPSTLRSLPSGTFRGPGEGAVPGAGCAPAGLTATAFAPDYRIPERSRSNGSAYAPTNGRLTGLSTEGGAMPTERLSMCKVREGARRRPS